MMLTSKTILAQSQARLSPPPCGEGKGGGRSNRKIWSPRRHRRRPKNLDTAPPTPWPGLTHGCPVRHFTRSQTALDWLDFGLRKPGWDTKSLPLFSRTSAPSCARRSGIFPALTQVKTPDRPSAGAVRGNSGGGMKLSRTAVGLTRPSRGHTHQSLNTRHCSPLPADHRHP